MEQEKDTNLPFRAEAADRDADLQKFADFLSEMIAKHICELDIDSFSLPDKKEKCGQMTTFFLTF